MEHIEVGKQFKFEKTGTTKNATFTGHAVLFPECLVLVPKRVTTENAAAASFFFGVLGALIASMFSSADAIEYPYPTVLYRDLPEPLRGVKALRKLKDAQRVVVVRREQIRGYTSSFLEGFRLICDGETIKIQGSRGKLISNFAKHGYPEHKA